MGENFKKQIESYIEEYKEANDGKRPSLRNIGEAFGVSYETVRKILNPEIKEGHKARQQHEHRVYDTEKSKEKVMECIEEFKRINGYAPTIRDLCKLLGLNSTSSVHRYVKMLEEDGKARSEENKARTLRDTELEVESIDEMIDTIKKQDVHKKNKKMSDVEFAKVVLEFKNTKGYAPSVRELCKITGLKSTSTVHSRIVKLCRLGVLSKEDVLTRTLRIKETEK
jgi:lexA repressor